MAQMVFTNRAANTTDPSFHLWKIILINQIVLTVSITTACIPYLRPFLDSVESGLLRSDDLRRRGLEGSYGYKSQPSRKSSSVPLSTVKSKRSETKVPTSDNPIPLRPAQDNAAVTTVQADISGWEDAQSTSSQSRIIRYTNTWTVDSEHADGSAPPEVVYAPDEV